MSEEWKDIARYIGIYAVSTHGRVKSLERKANVGHGKLRRVRERIIVPSTNRVNGRRYAVHVSLCLNAKVRVFQVARLVLEAFIGPCPEGMEAIHKDGNSLNNNLENLCWGKANRHPENSRRRKARKEKANA